MRLEQLNHLASRGSSLSKSLSSMEKKTPTPDKKTGSLLFQRGAWSHGWPNAADGCKPCGLGWQSLNKRKTEGKECIFSTKTGDEQLHNQHATQHSACFYHSRGPNAQSCNLKGKKKRENNVVPSKGHTEQPTIWYAVSEIQRKKISENVLLMLTLDATAPVSRVVPHRPQKFRNDT